MLSKSFTLLLLACFAAIAFSDLTCLDRQGNPKVWTVSYQFPGNVTNDTLRYAYLDDNLGPSFKIIPDKNADDKGEALANTIDAINNFQGENKSLMIFTNVPPDGNITSTGAHAKVILAFDNATQTGIYILHTFLSYPDFTSDGIINATADRSSNEYAQYNGVFGNYVYCMSINAEILDKLHSTIPLEEPNVIYASGIFNDPDPPIDANYTFTEFDLANQDHIVLLTKSPKFNAKFYEEVVVPHFNVSLAAESFGRPYQDPTCGEYDVVNVDEITFDAKNTWKIWADNAKWAITIGNSRPHLMCLSDFDRTDDQMERGGSAFCTNNVALWQAFTDIITAVDKCPSRRFRKIAM